jgi:hypothetical protein
MKCGWTGRRGPTHSRTCRFLKPGERAWVYGGDQARSEACLRRDLGGHALVGKEDGGLLHLVHPVRELDKLLLDGFAVHDARLHPRHTHVAEQDRSRRDGTSRQTARTGDKRGLVRDSACQLTDPNPENCSILERAVREISRPAMSSAGDFEACNDHVDAQHSRLLNPERRSNEFTFQRMISERKN